MSASGTVSAAILLAIVAGCARDGDSRHDGVDVGSDVALDSVPAAADAVAIPAAAERVIPPPPVLTAAPDTVPAAGVAELTALGAALVVPVAGVARSQLRDTFTEARGAGRPHEAIDIPAPRGTPVLSATDGRLLRLFDSQAGGLMVYATDASGRFILLYGHLDSYELGLRDGMPLQRGQVIGYVGTTGNAPPDTPHLHFGILRGDPAASWSSGVAVNPHPLLVQGGRLP